MTIPVWIINLIIVLIGIMIIYVWSYSSAKSEAEIEFESNNLIDLSGYDDFHEPLNKLVFFLYLFTAFLAFLSKTSTLIIFVYISLISFLEIFTKNIVKDRYGN